MAQNSQDQFVVLDRRIGAAMEQAMKYGEVPGGVVLVARGAKVLHHRAYGLKDTRTSEPATIDGIYDLASLTKPLATGLAIMQLMEEGRLSLSDPVSRHVPEWARAIERDRKTTGSEQQAEFRRLCQIRHLLSHTGGLVPFIRLWQRPGAGNISPGSARLDWAIESISSSTLRTTPGVEFVYSDLGFILLGRVVENLSGMSLKDYTAANIYGPLNLGDTGYRPDPGLLGRIAPTEAVRAVPGLDPEAIMLHGTVHDGNARWLGGVVGHAGLFSSAKDVAVLAGQLHRGPKAGADARILSKAAAAIMTETVESRTATGLVARRGLSWDKQTSFSYPMGDFWNRGVAHTGYTGTSVWIEPDLDLTIVILTNRVHPNGKGDAGALRVAIANAVKLTLFPDE